ncbi:MAG: glucosamine-6-phosphate deaminase [Oscillospiraceae bacterium]|nr:glucosamine-6-phosphate deaminase [Oscillospiraceae bacterium]
MVVKVCTNIEEVGKSAAAMFNAQVIKNPLSVLGLATGSSALPVYEEMINAHKLGLTDYAGITTFNLDEYCGLEPTHAQSYRYFMNENLFKQINIDTANTFFPDGTAKDFVQESARYEQSVSDRMGIDLQLLGLGHNGHIAFNEPCDAFPNATHCVQLTESTIQANARFFDSADDVPKAALTMGIGTIMRARAIVMVVFGEAKAEAVAAMVNGAITPKCPASILQLHPEVTIIADESAAKLLK